MGQLLKSQPLSPNVNHHDLSKSENCSFPMDDLSPNIQACKTDLDKLDGVSQQFDIDECLEKEFNLISEQYTQLAITYKSLLNARRFLNGNQTK